MKDTIRLVYGEPFDLSSGLPTFGGFDRGEPSSDADLKIITLTDVQVEVCLCWQQQLKFQGKGRSSFPKIFLIHYIGLMGWNLCL
jgi:hypothetical protein